MFAVVITEKGGAQRRMEFDKNEVTIGRVQGNDIILPKGNVSKRHSRIVLKDNRFIVVDLKSTNGTYVNGRKITSPLVVKPGDKVYIGDFILTVEDMGAGAQPMPPSQPQSAPAPQPGPPQPGPQTGPTGPSPSAPPPPGPSPRRGPPPLRSNPPPAPSPGPAAPPQAAPPQPAPPQAAPPQPAPPQPAPPQPAPPQPAPQPTPAPPQAAPAPAPSAPAPSAPAPSAPAPSAGQASGGDDFGLDQEPAEPQTNAPPPMRPKVGGGAKPATATVAEPPNGLAAVMAALEGQLDGLDDVSASRLDDPSRWAAAKKAIDAVVADLADVDADPDLANAALREAVGLGAFEGLLADEGIQEIVVEGPSKVLVDRGQGLVPSEAGFSSARMLTVIARRLAGRSGEAGAGPVLQAMLPEGAHAMIVLPPVAVGGPIVEIRRSGGSSLEGLVARGLPEDAASLLGKAVEAGQSVAVVGQKGASEVLAAIASSVDPSERVVAVGAVGPIDLPHVVHLAAGGLAGASLGAVALQASAMRADHLVVDGPVDGSCFDAFAAVASHGGGGFLGVRMPASQDPGAALVFAGRLAGKASEAAVAALVAQAVQVVVQVEDGAVVGIHEITGVEDGQVSTQPLFLFQGGSLVSTGASPSF